MVSRSLNSSGRSNELDDDADRATTDGVGTDGRGTETDGVTIYSGGSSTGSFLIFLLVSTSTPENTIKKTNEQDNLLHLGLHGWIKGFNHSITTILC